MAALSCAEARDLASDLLDGDLAPEIARLVQEHVASCPSCPSLYRALVAVHGELGRLREVEARDGPGGSTSAWEGARR
jgi:RNA polymerase sigma-70 factor (ECF subfamily)